MFTGVASFAQQDAQFTQYMYNTINVNPAYAGLTLIVLYMYCVNCASCCANLATPVNIKTNNSILVFIWFVFKPGIF